MARAAKIDRGVYEGYMKATGRAFRTAQLHRSQNHPDWVAWQNGQLREKVLGDKAPEGPVDVAPVVDLKLDLSGTPEEVMERQAFLTWTAVAEQIARVRRLSQFDRVPGLIKAEIEAQKSHRVASANRRAAEVERGTLIPLASLGPLWEAVAGVAQLLRNSPKEIGAKANPPDPGYGTLAVMEWLQQRLNPALDELERVVAGMVREAPVADENAG